jgi:Flp pilus assembly protein protease CpaA
MYIHAFHRSSFWTSMIMCGFGFAALLMLGFPLSLSLAASVMFLVFTVTVAGTVTDLMSMRIPDTFTLTLIAATVAWWTLSAFGFVPPEGSGSARDIMGMLLPGQGRGPIVPALDQSFPYAWLALDILCAAVVFFPLYYSFVFGMGIGGGDVKLMAALALFLGWPLGFDMVLLTFLFGGIGSCVVILARTICRILIGFMPEHALIMKMSKVKSFAYAPAISIAALICITQKAEGFFQ